MEIDVYTLNKDVISPYSTLAKQANTYLLCIACILVHQL